MLTEVLLLLTFLEISLSDDSVVYHLTESNFATETSQGKWILAFYAPWCGHCKQMKPHFEHAAMETFQNGVKVNYGMIDCTVERNICGEFKIRGFPTLKYKVNGRVGEYFGGRETEEFVEFSRRVTANPVVEVNSLEDFVDRRGVNFIFFGDDASALNVFQSVAGNYQHIDYIKFGKAKKDLMTPTPSKLPAVLMFNDNPLKRDGEYYTGKFTEEDLDNWISERDTAILNNINEYTWYLITGSGKKTLMAVGEQDKHKEYMDLVREFGAKDNTFTCAFLDSSKYERFLRQFDVEINDLPTVLIYDSPNQVHYYNNTYPKTLEGIKRFINDYQTGSIEAQGPGVGLQAKLNIWFMWLAEIAEENFYLTLSVVAISTTVIISIIIFLCNTEEPEEPKTKKEKAD